MRSMMARSLWPKPMGAWLAGLVLVLRGLGVAAVHAWPASRAAPQDVAQLAPSEPAVPDAAPEPTVPAPWAKAAWQVEPAPHSQDWEATTQRALKDSFTEPDPTSLGIVDYFGVKRVSQERLKVLASTKRFMVPWWGWLIFASILTVLAGTAFGLGALYTKQNMKALEASEKSASSGISRLVTSIRSGQTTEVGSSSKDSVSRYGSKASARPTDKPLPALEDFLPGGARSSTSVQQDTGGRCLPCLPQQCGNLFTKAVKRAIAAVDKKVIGVALHVGAIRVDVRSGLIEIDNLVLDNPEGYKSEYLLMIERLAVQVSMAKYIFSRGKNVVLDSLHVSDVEVKYEKALTTSNLDYVLNFANGATGSGQAEGSSATVTSSILGTIARGSTMAASAASTAASTAGQAASKVVGEETVSQGNEFMRKASMKVERAREETIVGRMSSIVGRNIGVTAGDVVDRTMDLVGTTAVIGTSAVALTAETLESQVTSVATGAISSAQKMTKSTAAAVTSAVGVSSEAIPEEEPAAAPEKPKEPPPDTSFVVKRLSVSNVGVTLASNLVGGRGVRLACADIDYQDFTGEMDITSGVDIVKFLLKTILLNSVKSVAGVGEFSLETAGRAMNLGRSLANEVEGSAVRAFQLV